MKKGSKLLVSMAAILMVAILLCSFTEEQFSSRLQKKIDNAVLGTYAIDSYTLERITVADKINKITKAELAGDNLFKVLQGEEFIGYIYVGETPSMKKVFDYIILFSPELTIKKSKVLIYREEYGLQIGSQRWLKQFIGLTLLDSAVYEKNIDGIAGATISASSMTRATDNVLKSLKILQEKELL